MGRGMMIKVTVEPAQRGRVTVTGETDGRVTYQDVITPQSRTQRRDCAKELGVPEEWLFETLRSTEPRTWEPEPPPASPPLHLLRREIGTPASQGENINGLARDILRTAIMGDTETVVEWEDGKVASILDVDYHHVLAHERPAPARLMFLMARITPSPVWWFVSRNGGVKALYLECNGIPANVLAAVGGFSFQSMDQVCTFEVLTRSRCTPGPLYDGSGTADITALGKFASGEVAQSAVTDWLDERGLTRGESYSHDLCPCDPGHASHGKPVFVGDVGIVCKSCESHGNMFGSRRPGFFPYTTLIGSHDQTDVAAMVSNFTHWTQARIVFESRCRIPAGLARLVYEGLLRLRHGDDERVHKAFHVGEHMIRGVGRWVTPDRYESLADLRPTLSCLPAVLGREGKPFPERLDMFNQTVELGRYGYASIRPLFGMRVFGQFLGSDGGPISVAIPPADLLSPQAAPLLPRYVSHSRRMPLDEAWAVVEEVFPHVRRDYLLLLLAARGVAEGETGIAANILVAGNTSTGKTQTVHLAASILGDKCTEIDWTPSDERFRQKYAEAADTGLFCCINELVKTASRSRVPPRMAFDSFLTLTPGSLSHKLYIGPVPLTKVPVTVVTETSVPQDVLTDQQLARRFVYVRLDRRIEWQEPIIRAGMVGPGGFRASSALRADAGNAIASHVIDTWFRGEPKALSVIAQELGFTTLEHADEVVDNPDALPHLFAEVCSAPDYADTRVKGRGWKKVALGDETTLADAWRAVCDGTLNLTQFTSSRKVMEVDWSTILNVPIGTRVDIMRHGANAFVRFRYGEARGGNYHVNAELLTCPGDRREPT
jgi:hypothetical protein